MNKDELKTILDNHKKWVSGEEGGMRADLSFTDLSNAYLSNADLRYADLRYADLRKADLRKADLSGANLSGADLSFSNLSGANLNGADLSNSDLDFSQLNLSCKGLNFKIDERIAKQIAYHLMNLMQHSGLNVNKIFKKESYRWLETSHLITKHNMPMLKNKEIEDEN